MDRPDLDPGLHTAALGGLGRLNRWSRSACILWAPVAALAAEAGGQTGRPIRLLDLASGGGDVPLGLWRRARRAGIPLEVTGVDLSPTAVAYARAAARSAGAPARFERRDVLCDPPAEEFDVVTCSLFLHHLNTDAAVDLLSVMRRLVGRLGLVNDLVRSRLGKAIADVACRLLSRSPVVHTDGPRSVEGAFTTEEASALCERAGLPAATVSPRWPCRMLIQWRADS